MPFRIDEAELVQALDRRVLATLPGSARTWSITDHFDYLHSLELADRSRDAVLAALVESANDALYQFSDGVSEDAREPTTGASPSTATCSASASAACRDRARMLAI